MGKEKKNRREMKLAPLPWLRPPLPSASPWKSNGQSRTGFTSIKQSSKHLHNVHIMCWFIPSWFKQGSDISPWPYRAIHHTAIINIQKHLRGHRTYIFVYIHYGIFSEKKNLEIHRLVSHNALILRFVLLSLLWSLGSFSKSQIW